MSIVPSPSARTRTSSNATLTDAAETRREDEKVNEQNEKDSSDSPRPSDLEEGLEVSEEVDPYTRFSRKSNFFISFQREENERVGGEGEKLKARCLLLPLVTLFPSSSVQPADSVPTLFVSTLQSS